MHAAAADLEFETAARLRDEIKRLRETELAIADDPLARQTDVEDKAGAFRGERKYGGAPTDRAAPPASPLAQARGSGWRSRRPSVPSPLGGEGQGEGDPLRRPPASSASTSRCSPPSRRPPPCPAPAPANPRSTTWAPAPTAPCRRAMPTPSRASASRRSTRWAPPATARSPRARPTSTRAPRPAPTARRSAARTSPPSTRWAPTPSAACPSPASPSPPKPPMKTMEIFAPAEKKARRGRPRKTGRPGA